MTGPSENQDQRHQKTTARASTGDAVEPKDGAGHIQALTRRNEDLKTEYNAKARDSYIDDE